MAVLEDVPGLEVYIKIDKFALQEYDDDEEVQASISPVEQYKRTRTVTKYVESATDEEFTVDINLNPGFIMTSDLATSIQIDGKVVRNPLIQKSARKAYLTGKEVHTRMTDVIDGAQTPVPGYDDQFLLQKFRFSKIETYLEDEKLKDVEKDSQRIAEVGEIVVTFYRAKTSGRIKSKRARDAIEIIMENAKVHEKALKGETKSHSVLLGPPCGLVKPTAISYRLLDGEDRPLAIFRFKYRSHDALKSLLIIERTPSPEAEVAPTSALVDVHKLYPSPSIKREHNSNSSDDSPRKKMKPGKSVIIDLTENSDDEIVTSLN
ncbi:uncharacterized protein RCO7_05806 [Rhynchosporium graminicola]|uniref:DUF7918 domain-containing protein n=1 Tax=Rhynchosporium graminicola TaxID=2792576 RepID=A0A1E1KB42_9HELO|nr:uncharacterized protein RCO7_05806 [Rhynchosporium commune]